MNVTLDRIAAFNDVVATYFREIIRPNTERSMASAAPSGIHRLHKGAVLVVDRPMHREVECLRGSLWITHDGDPKDVILGAEQAYCVTREARMLVQALDRSEVRLITTR